MDFYPFLIDPEKKKEEEKKEERRKNSTKLRCFAGRTVTA